MPKADIVKGEIVDTLTRAETAELRRQEKRIEKALPTFVEIGEALGTIRDSKLYRGTHATFDAYLDDRWGFTRQRASQLIGAAATVAELPAAVAPAIDSERKARAIRPVADKPGKAKAAVREASKTSTTGHPTAADLERAVTKVSGDGSVPTPPAGPSPGVDAWVTATNGLSIVAMDEATRVKVRGTAAGLVAAIDKFNGEDRKERQKVAAQSRAKKAVGTAATRTRSTTVTPRFKKGTA